MAIEALIVDLRQDIPKASDKFLVDSNVWYWMGYTKTSDNLKPYQINDYPHYLKSADNIQSELYKCTLSFSELAHSIERSEKVIFNAKRKASGFLEVADKAFRHNFPLERAKVITAIENAWVIVEAATNGLTVEAHVTSAMVKDSLKRIKTQELDGYDAFIVEALFAAGITQVITDDGDFGRVAGVTVFTANSRLIREADAQGKLIKR